MCRGRRKRRDAVVVATENLRTVVAPCITTFVATCCSARINSAPDYVVVIATFVTIIVTNGPARGHKIRSAKTLIRRQTFVAAGKKAVARFRKGEKARRWAGGDRPVAVAMKIGADLVELPPIACAVNFARDDRFVMWRGWREAPGADCREHCEVDEHSAHRFGGGGRAMERPHS